MADMARTAIDGAGIGLFARKAIAAVLLSERAMLCAVGREEFVGLSRLLEVAVWCDRWGRASTEVW